MGYYSGAIKGDLLFYFGQVMYLILLNNNPRITPIIHETIPTADKGGITNRLTKDLLIL